MLIDEILMNLNESAVCEAEHPEDCDCPKCMEECGDAESFWKETGIEESEEKELQSVNSKMRELMKKRSQSVPGSAKQEKINDELDKIYDRRHELMNKEILTEDGEGTKVLEALEDINTEQEINEKNFNCGSAEYSYKSGKLTCDGEDITDKFFHSADKAGSKAAEVNEDTANNAEAGANIGAKVGEFIGKGLDKAKEAGANIGAKIGNEFSKAREALHKDTAYMREDDEKGPWDPENQDPEKRYMLDAVTSAPEKNEYPDKVDEDAWDDEAIENAKKMDREGCADCTTVDGRDDMTPFKESVYKVSKADGSSEYIMAESAEKFAEYINESFEDIVSFEKINTKALNESMDHEIVDTIVAEVSKDKKASMGEITSMLNDMVDDSMSEEFVKTIYNKIVNRLSDAGIEVTE